jgi:hypothetical protein
MIRETPIGCRAFHYTRKVGKVDVCFYCGKEVFNWDNFKKREYNIQYLWMKMKAQIEKFRNTKPIYK